MESENQIACPPFCDAMPDTCDDEHELVIGPSEYSLTPTQSPDERPQLPGVACETFNVPMARTQPSVHHGLPFASSVIRCGVRPAAG